MDPLAIADAHDQRSPSGTYLNTASYGLPPRVGWDALQAGADVERVLEALA